MLQNQCIVGMWTPFTRTVDNGPKNEPKTQKRHSIRPCKFLCREIPLTIMALGRKGRCALTIAWWWLFEALYSASPELHLTLTQTQTTSDVTPAMLKLNVVPHVISRNVVNAFQVKFIYNILLCGPSSDWWKRATIRSGTTNKQHDQPGIRSQFAD